LSVCAAIIDDLRFFYRPDMLLEVKNLKTYFGGNGDVTKAVDDVSFHIDEGETFCLVGESGSGKSVTALSIIQLNPAGATSHPNGQILFDYRHDDGKIERVDMLRLPESARRQIRGARISMIFQEPMTSLNPVFTIGDQIIESLLLHRADMSELNAHARAIDVLEQVQIPNARQRIGEYPHRLSGGQRQRVMIAMAMALEPDLLIADEPTTALDVTVQAEILRLMKDLQARRGTSILFITHDLGVVSQMADRLAVMRLGKIVETGALEQVLKAPQHAYTKQLLAALPENLKKPSAGRIGTNRASVDLHAAELGTLLNLSRLQIYFPIKKGLLRRTVDHVKAVDGVSLQIPAGQIIALVGESGCGKTTLGRAILRLIEPTGGKISYEGQDITTLSRAGMKLFRRRMQVVFQDPISSLNPRLTVAGTLTEPLAVHGIGESREERLEIARRTLQRVQLDPDYLWRYPHEFSGGQRQRICIARALALDPSFIICDEVTSALDMSVQAEILKMLLDLRRERNLTILFITHDIGVVEYISDEIAVMYSGQIVERGTTGQVCGAPKHPYTQKLLAAVPRVRL
jgi:peptide/nickel transport system ATP-binding protein